FPVGTWSRRTLARCGGVWSHPSSLQGPGSREESPACRQQCGWARSCNLQLLGLAPSQAPQSARREDEGEGRGHAERDERPNPEKNSTGIADPAADKSWPPHVDDKDAQPRDRAEEHDDVPPSSFAEHQRSVQPDDENGRATEA